jgi:hypothetical protein
VVHEVRHDTARKHSVTVHCGDEVAPQPARDNATMRERMDRVRRAGARVTRSENRIRLT